MNGTPQPDRAAVRRDCLDVNYGGCRIPGQPRRIDHRNAPIQRKPDTAHRICNDGPVALHAFQAAKAIGYCIFAYVSLGQCSMQKLFAIHAQHLIRRCDPERSILVFGDAQYLRVQRLW